MIEILIVEIIFSKNVNTFLNNKFYIKTITRCYIRIIMLCPTAIKRLSRPICNCIVFKHKWLNIFLKQCLFLHFIQSHFQSTNKYQNYSKTEVLFIII